MTDLQILDTYGYTCVQRGRNFLQEKLARMRTMLLRGCFLKSQIQRQRTNSEVPG